MEHTRLLCDCDAVHVLALGDEGHNVRVHGHASVHLQNVRPHLLECPLVLHRSLAKSVERSGFYPSEEVLEGDEGYTFS